MPRYQFNTGKASGPFDDATADLKDHEAARVYAIVFAGEVLRSEPEVLLGGSDLIVQVRDAEDLLLFMVTAFATVAPAIGAPAIGARTAGA